MPALNPAFMRACTTIISSLLSGGVAGLSGGMAGLGAFWAASPGVAGAAAGVESVSVAGGARDEGREAGGSSGSVAAGAEVLGRSPTQQVGCCACACTVTVGSLCRPSLVQVQRRPSLVQVIVCSTYPEG